jgi:hypothetical protein
MVEVTKHNRTAAESIDHLVTTEMRMASETAGMIKPLYQAAREEASEPLTLGAAHALSETVDEGDTVLIATGAGKGTVNLPRGETDGPLGAVGIAHALALALGARPVITTEDHCVDPLIATARAGGFNNLGYEELLERQNAVSITPFTKNQDEADAEAERFLEMYDPSAIIAIEKGGPNRNGVYHSALGTDMTPGRAKVAPLFDRANDKGILTIGVGDNGNEVGWGQIEEAVREIQPYGRTCQCPCEGGNACRIATDHFVVANTSNWGAYGVEAMLALLTETPDALHTPDDELRMLEYNILSGSNDGVYDRPIMKVDGTSEDTQHGIVAMLNDIVTNGLTERYDRGF